MKKLLIIILALILAAMSGFFVSGVLAPLSMHLPITDTSSAPIEMQEEITPEELMEVIVLSEQSSSIASQVTTPRTPGIYARYAEGVVGRGRSILLYFHDPASNASTEIDALLRRTYGAGTATIDTYRIDTPSMQTLLTLYGVTATPSFVKLGPSGDILRTITSPNMQEVPALLSSQ